jgi:holo-[acyl-carrier protein] synthase
MCKGLGLDLCEIARMEKLLKDDRFISRFFTPDEKAYVLSRGKGAAATLAGLFAAREALGKALGCGIDFDLKEAEVCHTESGAPYYRLSGSLKNRVGNNRLFLSISHDGGMAAAVCLIEGESET